MPKTRFLEKKCLREVAPLVVGGLEEERGPGVVKRVAYFVVVSCVPPELVRFRAAVRLFWQGLRGFAEHILVQQPVDLLTALDLSVLSQVESNTSGYEVNRRRRGASCARSQLSGESLARRSFEQHAVELLDQARMGERRPIWSPGELRRI